VTDCVNEEIRDALPDMLHGRLSEVNAATMTAHVESCADCRAELALLREVRASAPIPPAIDSARIAAAIRPYGRVTTEALPSARRSVLARAGGWRLTLVAALVAIGAWATTDSGLARFNGSGRGSDNPVAQVEARSLSLVGGVQDLTDADIEELLADIDGVEAIPSAEPGPITLALEYTEGEEP
jgi:predicted anti-sigma-YlaC factor YlaD